MKPVMYHYVRPCVEGLPYFPYLALADFERQLDTFASTCGFVGREAFVDWAQGGPAPDGVLLTFDDGLRDHRDFVLPVLQERGLIVNDRLDEYDGTTAVVRTEGMVPSQIEFMRWRAERFVHTRCFTRDITDRKRYEQRLLVQFGVGRVLA